jgi:hypothetical protein
MRRKTMITMEEKPELEQMELPGLINESLHCQCHLHGFEIDLDGNVILPMLVGNNKATDCHQK